MEKYSDKIVLTPKEKAENLIHQFRKVQDFNGKRMLNRHMRECAVTFVDELLKLKMRDKLSDDDVLLFNRTYWEEVKNELENTYT